MCSFSSLSSGGVEDEVEVSVRPRRCATDFMDGGGSVDWELFFADMYSVEDGQLSFGVDASSEGGGLVTLDEVEAYAEADERSEVIATSEVSHR